MNEYSQQKRKNLLNNLIVKIFLSFLFKPSSSLNLLKASSPNSKNFISSVNTSTVNKILQLKNKLIVNCGSAEYVKSKNFDLNILSIKN
ncbi:hypothetical protein BpHYR1_047576 [Brachionus plicatilis]|uniref:Uncharacterized protein n=1 Tax=Brachionus plicatilis TaxID=10195 RepID=A0A3M7SSC9_BRAPC|nr:hypothetical protein BpHYR1_047576 [Brachionus plicatilis]